MTQWLWNQLDHTKIIHIWFSDGLPCQHLITHRSRGQSTVWKHWKQSETVNTSIKIFQRANNVRQYTALYYIIISIRCQEWGRHHTEITSKLTVNSARNTPGLSEVIIERLLKTIQCSYTQSTAPQLSRKINEMTFHLSNQARNFEVHNRTYNTVEDCNGNIMTV